MHLLCCIWRIYFGTLESQVFLLIWKTGFRWEIGGWGENCPKLTYPAATIAHFCPSISQQPTSIPLSCEAVNQLHPFTRTQINGIWLTSAVLAQTPSRKWATNPACRVEQQAESMFYISAHCVNQVNKYEYKDSFWVLIKGIQNTCLCFHSFLKLPAQQLSMKGEIFASWYLCSGGQELY
jgi:hypothetical protein